MIEIKKHLVGINQKITNLKTNLKTSLSIVNELSTEYIEKLLCKNSSCKTELKIYDATESYLGIRPL